MNVVTQATISGLFIYPVKSCAGIAVSQAQVTVTGLEHDRRWLWVNADGYFITQREQPRLALIQPALHEQDLMLTAPGMSPLQVSGTTQARRMDVIIWRDQCVGFDAGDAVAEWGSDFLNQQVRLVRFDDAKQRLSDHHWTAGVQAPNHFSDGFPILVVSIASLADLNSRLTQPLPMNRFRPNIVIDGVAPYAEDQIAELSDGELRLRLVKPCTRCKITTTNQLTGVIEGDEPLLTLVRYRRDLALKGVTFGQNAIVVAGVGARVSVTQTLAVVQKTDA